MDRSFSGAKMPEETEPSQKQRNKIVGSLMDNSPFQKEQLDNFLESVDFGILRRRFKALAKRCGIEQENVNFIEKHNIISSGYNSTGFFYPDYNVLGLNISVINYYLRYEFLLNKDYSSFKFETLNDIECTFLLRLHLLIHEEVHAMAFLKLGGWNPRIKIKARAEYYGGQYHKGLYEHVQTGFNITNRSLKKDGKMEYSNDYHQFNEAITDLIALEVFQDYLKEVGEISEKAISEYLMRYNDTTGYGKYVPLVKKMITTIALRSGVDEPSVWKAIKRNYLEGIDFNNSEFAELVDAHTYAGFLNEIKNEKIKKDKKTGKVIGTAFHDCVLKLSNIKYDKKNRTSSPSRKSKKI